ncbi:hypothetical protein NDU88_005112 [Pleurodeles waltl]|uniref:Uncharacterized protein n=1 Tax=Pleurodeles waltl TaxID=8319 RepID=A0AAV7NLJ8_PLEWA|nr:hypothetical protein NDU88_005112 [Pleurodeles waltl]
MVVPHLNLIEANTLGEKITLPEVLGADPAPCEDLRCSPNAEARLGVTQSGQGDLDVPRIALTPDSGRDRDDRCLSGLRGGEALLERDVERRIVCKGLSAQIPPRVASASGENVRAIIDAMVELAREGARSYLPPPYLLFQ